MSIIIISRGAHHKGEEVAEKTAQKLGYVCLSRDILLEASKQYNVPEIKLKKSMERAPGFLERLGVEKEKYISYVQSTLLKRLKEDNIVYHGLAGQVFVQNISHALKVRVIANIKDRVSYCMQSEGVSSEKALDMLRKLDEERKKWGQYLYGIDISDPGLYDLVINIERLSVDDAADIICHAAALDKFKTTPESNQALHDLALAAEAKALLINKFPPKNIRAKNGVLFVTLQASLLQEAELAEKVQEICARIKDVKETQVEIIPYIQPIEIAE